MNSGIHQQKVGKKSIFNKPDIAINVITSKEA